MSIILVMSQKEKVATKAFPNVSDWMPSVTWSIPYRGSKHVDQATLEKIESHFARLAEEKDPSNVYGADASVIGKRIVLTIGTFAT